MSQLGPIAARTTTLLTTNSLLSSLRNTQVDLLKRQEQISTGLLVSKPSDAPADTSGILKFQGKIEAREQFENNLQFALSMLNNTDQGLGDALNIVLDAKALASSQIGVGSSAETRENQALVIDGQLQGLLEIANRDIQGLALFGGRRSNTTQGSAFVEFLGGIQYVGAEENLAADVGLNKPLTFNSNGQDAFGALSARVKGSVDLDPQSVEPIFLKDINGAQGFGFRPGSIDVTVDAMSFTVDLTDAETIRDVVTRINDVLANQAVPPLAGTITAAGTGLTLTANAGRTITIDNVGTGQTASDLGIMISATATTTPGADIDPRLTELTTLASLGATVDFASGLKITQGGQTQIADFSTATTIQDMINVVDQMQLGLRMEINETGTGLNLASDISGIELSIGENAGGTTAEDLGLRTFGQATLLADFRHGIGVSSQLGQDDFAIELHDGTTFNVNIDGLTTVSEVITAIQTAATGAGLTVGAPGAGGTQFNVGLALDGNGFTFEDNTAGGADFQVVQLGISLAATDLGIYTSAGSGTTIIGEDVAKVQVESVFTHLISLRNSLVNNDSRGITFAGERLEGDLGNLSRVRADVGVRSQRVEQQQQRSAEMKISEQIFLSDLRDADLTEVITKFSQLQQQLEATLLVGSQSLQLSLLDFLR